MQGAIIEENIKRVKERIAKASQKVGRTPDEIRLVCVTKDVGIEEIKEVLQAGITEIGENRVQPALEKYNYLTCDRQYLTDITWHMVGHLQTNKVQSAIKIFNLIHSVDSLGLACEINRRAATINKTVDVLVQVNTSSEKTKSGIAPSKVLELVKDILNLSCLRIQGLMTIAPLVKEPEESRPYFQKLRLLRDEINEFLVSNRYSLLATLSMGMSGDFEVAIEEGANIVRLGRAIFEDAD